MVKSETLLVGKFFKIQAIIENDRCYFKEFYDGLNESDKKKILALLKRIAEEGPINNEEKFKKLEGDVWEFKSYQIRVLCGFSPGKVVLLTHGFIKKKQKTPKKRN